MTTLVLQDGDRLGIKDSAIVTISSVPRASIGSGLPEATEFRLPMADLDKPWYEATRRFGPYNQHPERCEDWNLESGGDTDLGEPLVAPFAGLVINARNWGGAWGKIVRILGRTPGGELICWMGAHLAEMHVEPGDVVQMGDPVGTIGTGEGRYAAHLHEQISVGELPAPTTFGGDRSFDFRQPSKFYQEHGVDVKLVKRSTEYNGQ